MTKSFFGDANDGKTIRLIRSLLYYASLIPPQRSSNIYQYFPVYQIPVSPAENDPVPAVNQGWRETRQY
jgi:hypothetical protein